jgi:hypothetical protein
VIKSNKENMNKVKIKDQIGPSVKLCKSKVENNIENQSITIMKGESMLW